MKLHLSLLSAAASIAPCVVSAVPENVAGYTIQVELGQAQACDTEMYQEAKGPWFDMPMTPLRLEFPANGSNDYTTPHPHNDAQNKWPDIQVCYAANAAANQAYVKVGNKDFDSLCILTFRDALHGTAEVFLHESGQTRHFRHVTFSMGKGWGSMSPIKLPQPDETDGDPELWDDGLNDILAELENLTCKSATDKLYRKRLLMLLPLIQVNHNPNTTTPETKGNTAMHYACGLSHVELVKWLIAHGADLESRTEKGATIDACIGGKNAAAIKKLLEKAREKESSEIEAEFEATPRLLVDAPGAARCAALLEQLFTGTYDTYVYYSDETQDEHALLYAENLYHYAETMGRLPQGVHPFTRMGRMVNWALEARLKNADFCQIVIKELREERLNKLDAAIEAQSLFVDAFIQLPKLGDNVERVIVSFSQDTAKAPVVDIVRLGGDSSFTPYTAKMHVCDRISLKEGARATLLVAPEYHDLSMAEPEARFSMDIARHFGKHFRTVSYFVGNKTLNLFYTPEGEINMQRTTDAVPQDVYCVPIEFKVKVK